MLLERLKRVYLIMIFSRIYHLRVIVIHLTQTEALIIMVLLLIAGMVPEQRKWHR